MDDGVDDFTHISSTGSGQLAKTFAGPLTGVPKARRHWGNRGFAQPEAVLKVITTEFSYKDLRD